MPRKSAGGMGPRASERKERRIAARITQGMPKDVKRYFVDKYCGPGELVEQAIVRLLAGASHVCPACGHDNGPKYACGCDQPNPAMVRGMLEMAGALGPPGLVIIGLLQGLGVKSEDEARELIVSGKRLVQLREAGVTARESFESAMDLLRLSFMEEPGLREEALARLGGNVNANANGSMNGHAG